MSNPRIEHLEDFAAHEWCKALFADPSITHIHDRRLFDARHGWNYLFTRGLFTSDAIRAFLDLYKPGKGQRRKVIDPSSIVTHTSTTWEEIVPRDNPKEAARQVEKQDIQYDLSDPEAAEHIVLVSLAHDADGNVNSLHGGVTASLLDHCMGGLVLKYFGIPNATSELRVTYKKNVVTPCVVKVRARIKREKGRWVEVVSWVEDGEGGVYAEGWGSFVKNKVAMAKM
jgi:acyl-coenzyme A thioesterase PaaI-like protein